jgi:hypothetical protein
MECFARFSYPNRNFVVLFSVGILLQIYITTSVAHLHCNFTTLIVRLGGVSTLIFGGKILIFFLTNQNS